jgi:hypothetical protein
VVIGTEGHGQRRLGPIDRAIENGDAVSKPMGPAPVTSTLSSGRQACAAT